MTFFISNLRFKSWGSTLKKINFLEYNNKYVRFNVRNVFSKLFKNMRNVPLRLFGDTLSVLIKLSENRLILKCLKINLKIF